MCSIRGGGGGWARATVLSPPDVAAALAVLAALPILAASAVLAMQSVSGFKRMALPEPCFGFEGLADR